MTIALTAMEDIGDGIGKFQEGIMSLASYRGNHRCENER